MFWNIPEASISQFFLPSNFEKNSIFSAGNLPEASTTFHRAIFGLQISKFFFFQWHHSQFPFWEAPPKSLYKPPPFQPVWLSGHCPFSPLLYHSLLHPARDWRSTAVQKVASHYFSLTGVSSCYLSFCSAMVLLLWLYLFCFFSLLLFLYPSAPLYWGLFLCLVIVALALNPTLDLLKPFNNLKSHFCFFRLKKISCITYVIGWRLNKMTLKRL